LVERDEVTIIVLSGNARTKEEHSSTIFSENQKGVGLASETGSAGFAFRLRQAKLSDLSAVAQKGIKKVSSPNDTRAGSHDRNAGSAVCP
jgi:hypothetical protein